MGRDIGVLAAVSVVFPARRVGGTFIALPLFGRENRAAYYETFLVALQFFRGI